MSFADFEASRGSGTAVECFLFVYGAGVSDYYAFTDTDRTVTHPTSLIDFTPFPMDRDRITVDGGRDRKELVIFTTARNPLVDLFQIYPPDQTITVLIQATHLDDPDGEFVPLWMGRVINCKSHMDGTAEITCRPMSSAYRQAGLRRHWQFGCPHVLYGLQCGANEGAATITRLVTNLDSNRVTLATGWNVAAPEKYIGGKAKWTIGANTYNRTILRVGGDLRTLSLSGIPIGLTVGGNLTVTLGCNHQMDDCLTLHGNINNFGGDPWIPTVNPVNTNPYV